MDRFLVNADYGFGAAALDADLVGLMGSFNPGKQTELILAMLNDPVHTVGAKGFRRGKQVDGLQQAGLAAGIFPVNNVQLRMGLDFHVHQVPNMVHPQQCDAHALALEAHGHYDVFTIVFANPLDQATVI